MAGPVDGVPEELVAAMLPDGPDDDVAILVARVDPPSGEESLSQRLEPNETAVAEARHLVTSYLEERAMPARAGRRRRAGDQRAGHQRRCCTAGRRSSCGSGSRAPTC